MFAIAAFLLLALAGVPSLPTTPAARAAQPIQPATNQARVQGPSPILAVVMDSGPRDLRPHNLPSPPGSAVPERYFDSGLPLAVARYPRGLKAYMDAVVAHAKQLGFTRIYVRGPYGRVAPTGARDLDAALTNRVLVREWQAVLTKHADIQFIMHLGEWSPTLQRLATTDQPAMRARIEASLAPLLAHPNVQPMIEGAANLDNDDPRWAVYKSIDTDLRRQRRALWVSPHPPLYNADRRDQLAMPALAPAAWATLETPLSSRSAADAWRDPLANNLNFPERAVFDERARSLAQVKALIDRCGARGWTPVINANAAAVLASQAQSRWLDSAQLQRATPEPILAISLNTGPRDLRPYNFPNEPGKGIPAKYHATGIAIPAARHPRGLEGYIDDLLADAKRFGYRRLYVRGPYGQVGTNPPHQLDTGVTNTVLVEEWARIMRKHPDVQFLMHLGSWSERLQQLSRSDPAAMERRMRDAIAPILASPNAVPIIDTAAEWNNADRAWKVLLGIDRTLQRTGRRLWVEAHPRLHRDEVRDQLAMPSMSIDTLVQLELPRDNRNAADVHRTPPRLGAVPEAMPERVVQFHRGGTTREIDAFTARCGSRGWTPMLNATSALTARRSAAQVKDRWLRASAEAARAQAN